MDYSVRGRTICPEMVVDVFVDDAPFLEDCPTVFRAILVCQGAALIQINGQRFFVEAPSVLCLNGSEQISLLKSDSFSVCTVFFKPQVINSRFTLDYIYSADIRCEHSTERQDLYWLDYFISERGPELCIRLGPHAMERILAILASLRKSLTEQIDGYWPCRSRSHFLEFLFYIREDSNKYGEYKTGFGKIPERIEDVYLYLHSHYHQDISLSSLCERFAINRTSLNEYFLKYSGQTVIQYLIHLRIRLASLFLRDTMVPVKELVYRTGFSDPVNFNRTFKRITNYTPSQYRKEFNWILM